MVVVAATQFSLSHQTLLSPWKGGGFGMFASIQSPDSRWLEAYGCLDGAWHPIEHLGEKRREQRLRAMPSASRLEALAENLFGGQFCLRMRTIPPADRAPSCSNEGPIVTVLTRASDERATCAPRRLNAVEVAVYQSAFEPMSGAQARLERQRLFHHQTGPCARDPHEDAP